MDAESCVARRYVLGLLVLVGGPCISQAAPAWFWLSLSETQPYRHSLYDPPSDSPQRVKVDLVPQAAAKLYVWGTPQTTGPGPWAPAANPFRRLQSVSLDATAQGPAAGLVAGRIDNPDGRPGAPGGERFVGFGEFLPGVIDSDHPFTSGATDLFGQPIVAPIVTGSRIEGLLGFTGIPTDDSGVGPDCVGEFGTCVLGTGGPAWLIGSIEVEAASLGESEVRLRLGASSLAHVGETAASSQVVFGEADGVVYETANACDAWDPFSPPGSCVAHDPSDTPDAVIRVVESWPGDNNGDNRVDAGDYNLWRDSFGQTGPGLPADANGDGVVDEADFARWAGNFGRITTPSDEGVFRTPSPGTATLVAVALLAGWLGGVRRRLGAMAVLAVVAVSPLPIEAVQLSSNWLTAADGDWDSAANWDTVAFPNNGADTYAVTINATGSPYTVTLDTGVTIDSLVLDSADATLQVQSVLGVVGAADLRAGSAVLAGGAIVGGEIVQSPTTTLAFTGSSNNRLDGATLQGDLRLDAFTSAKVRLQNGATFTGDAFVGNNAILGVEDNLTLDNKTITLLGGAGSNRSSLSVIGTNTLTLGPSAVVDLAGPGARITSDLLVGGFGTVINEGTVNVSGGTAGNVIQINPDAFDNRGTVEVQTGSTVRLTPTASWSNSGLYEVAAGATLELLGTITTAGLGTVDNTSGGTVSLMGTINNAGDTLDASASTGTLILAGGAIVGGEIVQSPTTTLAFTGSSNNRLDGATLQGDLRLDAFTSAKVRLQNGATFTGDAFVGNNAILGVEDNLTLDNKTITLLGGAGSNRSSLSVLGTNTLTLGPSAVVDLAGPGARITSDLLVGGFGTVINEGTVNVSGGTAGNVIQINPDAFDNRGTVEVQTGSTVRLTPTASWSNSGLYEVAAGATLELLGTITTAGLGTVDNTSGGTVSLMGTINNAGDTLDASASTGTLILAGGAIVGGEIVQSPTTTLAFTGSSNNRLDGATLQGDLRLDAFTSAKVRLQNGATFTGDAFVGNNAILGVEDNLTLDNKTITLLGGAGSNRSSLSVIGTNTLTLGPSAVVDLAGPGARITSDLLVGGFGTVINEGTVNVRGVVGRTPEISADVFDNRGKFEIAGGSRVLVSRAFTHRDAAVLLGTGTVEIAQFVNEALVAPGASPGVITIEGDYTQTSDGSLEIEIGGTATAGVDFDRLAVTGTATLAGRLDVPLINGYVPQSGDTVTFLTANSVVGAFEVYNFPNTLPDDVAQQLVYTATDVSVEFVDPIPIEFVSTDAAAEWTTPTDWEENGVDATPDSVNLLSVGNNLGSGQTQTVDVVSPVTPTAINAAHRLTVGDEADPIVVRVNDTALSTTLETTVTANGAIEQSGASVLSARTVEIESGGRFSGSGSVIGDIQVGAVGAALSLAKAHHSSVVSEAVFEVGVAEVAELAVEGDYEQGAEGVFGVDIVNDDPGGFDRLVIDGAATVGGLIRVNAAGLDASFEPGDSYEVLAATSLAPGNEFDQIDVVGRDDVYFRATYEDGGSEVDLVRLTGWRRGDIVADGQIDELDAQVFAATLLDNRIAAFEYEVEAPGGGTETRTVVSGFSTLDFPGTTAGVDLFDVPFFAQALANDQGVSLSAAYSTIDMALARAVRGPTVPEPGAATMVVALLAAPSIVPRRRCQE